MRSEALLTLLGPAFPSVWAWKVELALVLLEVSELSVVLGLIASCADALRDTKVVTQKTDTLRRRALQTIGVYQQPNISCGVDRGPFSF